MDRRPVASVLPFAALFAADAAKSALLPPDARILIALSGGPDSTALLLALCECADAGLLPRPVGAAHFHHGLRGADADADAASSAALCARLGLPAVVGIGAVHPQPGQSPNDAARAARYAFLREAAIDFGADRIATAHNVNDQAETVLGRVLRGTSVDGLAGIPLRREGEAGLTIVRPLLGRSRPEIEAYCAERGVEPRRDPSNEKPRYARARLRQKLPELAAAFNPRLNAALARLAEHAAADSDLLSKLAESLWAKCVFAAPEGIRIDAPRLRAAHSALRGRVLIRALRAVCPNAVRAEAAAVTDSVTRLERLMNAPTGASASLAGGLYACRRDADILLSAAPPTAAAALVFDLELRVPGVTDVPAAGLQIVVEWRVAGEPLLRQRGSRQIDMAYNAQGIPPGLRVRAVQMGDRIAPLGMGGRTRRVSDLLSEHRVPIAERSRAALIVDSATGTPIWLVGICQAESTRVLDEGAAVLRLRAEGPREEVPH